MLSSCKHICTRTHVCKHLGAVDLQKSVYSLNIMAGLMLLQYPLAIELIESGAIDLKPMITHRYNFNTEKDVIDGFECSANASKTKAIKVMFNL